MRQIKFRAWHKESMIVSQSRLLYSHGKWNVSGRKSDEYEPIHGHIMQFTGLLDKNGKEIYEGDVVNYREFIESENEIQQEIQGARGVQIDEIGTVEWDNEGADFSIFLKTGGCRGFNARGEGIEIEIIGNIYENPELLK